MTDSTTLLVAIVGCLLVSIAWAIFLETSGKRHRKRHAAAPDDAATVRDPESIPPSDRPGASAYPASGATPTYPDDWVPLSRMTREEVEAHLWRLEGNPGGYIPEPWPKRTARTVDLTPPASEEIRVSHSIYGPARAAVHARSHIDQHTDEQVDRAVEEYVAEHLPGWRRTETLTAPTFAGSLTTTAFYEPAPEEER